VMQLIVWAKFADVSEEHVTYIQSRRVRSEAGGTGGNPGG
jgi:hypothetical protein